MEQIFCKHCKSFKDTIYMKSDKTSKSGFRSSCKICTNIQAKKYHKKNPERSKKYNLLRKFNLNLTNYNEMLKKQNNVCKICLQHEKNNRNLAVDHCHKTNKIRGLLCTQCNTGLGLFNDNIDTMLKAINYLKQTKGE